MNALLAFLVAPCLFGDGPEVKIEAAQKIFRPGRPMPIRIILENGGKAPAELEEPDDYLKGFAITDEAGKAVKEPEKADAGRRHTDVAPGGFVGRTVDVKGLLDLKPEQEGWYRFRWSHGGRRSNELRILVLTDWRAEVETNHGEIVIALRPDVAPNHVLRFVKLARSGFYDGSCFHRIIRGFMMQGGIPAREVPLPERMKAELSDLKHEFGTVSMARAAGVDTATCQFFICFSVTANMDRRYTVFGKVVEGEEVVRRIEKVRTDHDPCTGCGRRAPAVGSGSCCGKKGHHVDRPLVDVVIKRVNLLKPKE